MPVQITRTTTYPPDGVVRSLSPVSALGFGIHEQLAALRDYLPADTPVHGDESLVSVLEWRVAALLGKERALFFPTGAMAQQVALRVHAIAQGRTASAAHPFNHLVRWEGDGYRLVHGLRMMLVGAEDRLMTLSDLELLPMDELATVVWELPQRDLGGQQPEWTDLVEQTQYVASKGVCTHLDGARLWESQTGYEASLAEIAALFDSVYVSLYKGLRAPRGAVLAGSSDFIERAAEWQLRLGGRIPEAWPLAGLGLYGIDRFLPQFDEFRQLARDFAEAVMADGVGQVVPFPPQTPLFHVVLPVSVDAAAAAHVELVRRTGSELFASLRSGLDRSSTCSFEITVHESSRAFTPADVALLIRQLVELADPGTPLP